MARDVSRRLVALVGCSMAWLAQAAVAGVVPTRASNVVTLLAVFTPCPAAATAELFDTEILPDGTRAPFLLPAGKVLVVNGLEYTGTQIPVPAVSATLLHATTGEELFFTVGPVHSFGPGNDTVHHNTLVPQLVVKGGICVQAETGTSPPRPIQAVLHGFLAADR
jgi:hypothetical protein